MSAINLIEAVSVRLKSALRSGVSSPFSRDMATNGMSSNAPPTSPSAKGTASCTNADLRLARMQKIEAEHGAILDRFEETAWLGHVPADALIEQLLANHHKALAEKKQQLGDAEEALLGCLRRLNARFPAPLPPEPEKPIPPRPKVFRSLAKIRHNPRRSGPFINIQ
jgi:hypothetical protein